MDNNSDRGWNWYGEIYIDGLPFYRQRTHRHGPKCWNIQASDPQPINNFWSQLIIATSFTFHRMCSLYEIDIPCHHDWHQMPLSYRTREVLMIIINCLLANICIDIFVYGSVSTFPKSNDRIWLIRRRGNPMKLTSDVHRDLSTRWNWRAYISVCRHIVSMLGRKCLQTRGSRRPWIFNAVSPDRNRQQFCNTSVCVSAIISTDVFKRVLICLI